MNPPKCDDLDYIHFLIAAQKVFTCTEAARCAPEEERAPAHDAFTRLLPRQPPDTEALWQEAKAFVDVGKGLLVYLWTQRCLHPDLRRDVWRPVWRRMLLRLRTFLLARLWTFLLARFRCSAVSQ
jgi:hypothetical protein